MKRPQLAASMNALKRDAPDPLALVANARAPTPKATAATREGMKRLLVPLVPALHKRLKIAAATNEKTLEAMAREALEDYLSKHESK